MDVDKDKQIIFDVIESEHSEGLEIVGVHYDLQFLRVDLASPTLDGRISMTFERPSGFRVLDEGDLLEFWGSLTSEQGWAFRIHAGGWLEQESQRSGFVSQHHEGLQEYLIIGENDCISVLSHSYPTIVFPEVA
ncbi:hypothetical protein EUZ85_26770 [Hahella sp. KA22]|uniref:hypothetical protein n=1 Tax=Hahella sp. KA22 TaxID=1628392 RepID=UPI000FDF5B9C|nr:hypothetical protein [Hahella sp. KA22]AZZ94126.1 hypothetical protein ENC22_24185 [Hahella sp. KA22]QAY57500.1 hypothetical protein EUZ85_26770 [Hahella sp. KA22]